MRYLTSTTETRLSTLYNEWQVLKSQVPKGFEKYFPGGKKPQVKSEEAPKTETKGLYNLDYSLVVLVSQRRRLRGFTACVFYIDAIQYDNLYLTRVQSM